MALSPASSHGGGLPSAWTADATSGALLIAIPAAGGENAALEIDIPHTGGYASGSPYTLLVRERTTNFDLVRLDSSAGAGGYTEQQILTPDPASSADLFVGSYGLVKHDASGARVARLIEGGYWSTQAHAAPADGTLATGELALWFDQTNGAAKLMVKAKQADGTVKTAAVALS